jgi:DNA-binding NarL/FixJ family response regulator
MRVVVFTAHANADLAIRSLDCGAHAFVLKGASAEELFEAVESANRGDVYITPSFSAKIFAGLRERDGSAQSAFATLSHREKQLVELLQQGKTNKEIAVALDLTEKTIKHYMTNLMAKLHVKNRVEVVIASQKLAM